MIVSAVPWGFLSDVLGRKKLLVFGYFMDSVIVFSSAFAQSLWDLMILKFLGGLM